MKIAGETWLRPMQSTKWRIFILSSDKYRTAIDNDDDDDNLSCTLENVKFEDTAQPKPV